MQTGLECDCRQILGSRADNFATSTCSDTDQRPVLWIRQSDLRSERHGLYERDYRKAVTDVDPGLTLPQMLLRWPPQLYLRAAPYMARGSGFQNKSCLEQIPVVACVARCWEAPAPENSAEGFQSTRAACTDARGYSAQGSKC